MHEGPLLTDQKDAEKCVFFFFLRRYQKQSAHDFENPFHLVLVASWLIIYHCHGLLFSKDTYDWR